MHADPLTAGSFVYRQSPPRQWAGDLKRYTAYVVSKTQFEVFCWMQAIIPYKYVLLQINAVNSND